jgi:hypothetical protein
LKICPFQKFLVVISLLLSVFCLAISAQETPKSETTQLCKIGEKLTYEVSFNKFKDAGYAEIYCVSKGKLEERDALELRAKWRTNDFVSAAYYLLDETRNTFISTDTGFPLFTKKISNENLLPKETIKSYLENPTNNVDLLAAIYQARNLNGNGTITFQEDDKTYSLTLQSVGNEKIKNDLGEFETTVYSIQSQYFTDNGISDFRVNISNDERKLPVAVSLKVAKGIFKATLASSNMIVPETNETDETPTPTPTPKPTPIPTPKPTPTQITYVENQNLSTDLPFSLGEQLTFKVTSQGQNLGNVILQVKERKQVSGKDSLILSAMVNSPVKLFGANDSVSSIVDPETIVPYKFEVKASGILSKFNQTVVFDQTRGVANQAIQIPVGTHDLLSLAYAIRAFNLKPSKNPNSPVNDTRVAVMLGNQAQILIVRPVSTETITFQKRKISAQVISISSEDMKVSQLTIKLWLSNDSKRLPLKFSVGTFQAELVSVNQVSPN